MIKIVINGLQESSSAFGGYNADFSINGEEQGVAHIHEGMRSENSKALLKQIELYIKDNDVEPAPDYEKIAKEKEQEAAERRDKKQKEKDDKIEKFISLQKKINPDVSEDVLKSLSDILIN